MTPPISLLRKRSYVLAGKKEVGEKSKLLYILPDEVKDKLFRVLKLTKMPDFALILNGRLEKGTKRIFNVEGTRYVLFYWENNIPRLIPCNESQKTFRRTSKRDFWDTPAGIRVKE